MNIVCSICHKEVNTKGLTFHLKGKHSQTFMEYVCNNLEQFPNYNPCKICAKITAGTCCSRECISTWKSITYKGRKGWSKGLTKDTHPGLLSMANKAKLRTGVNIWERMTPETSAKARLKISINTKSRVSGINNPMYGKTHTPKAIQKIFKYRKISSAEQIVADFLDLNNIQYYHQFFITDTCKYSYDFKIKKSNIIIEVDGDYWHGGPGCKKYCNDVESNKIRDIEKNKIAQSKGYRLYRIWESELKTNPTILYDILNIN
jgi:very-short-patch-repair endonuclease